MEKEHFGKKINILSKKIKWRFNEISEKHGVTGVQARVLHFIVCHKSNEEVLQKDIEKEFNLRRSTVTNILQLLEDKKLIIRVTDKEDGRIKKIRLTKEGQELQKLLTDELLEFEKLLVQNIDKEELVVFSKVLDEINNNIIKIV